MRAANGREAFRRDGVRAPRQTRALIAAGRQFPPDEPLRLEPVERRVERAARHAAPRVVLQCAADAHTVRVGLETKDSEKDQLFEFAQVRPCRHQSTL